MRVQNKGLILDKIKELESASEEIVLSFIAHGDIEKDHLASEVSSQSRVLRAQADILRWAIGLLSEPSSVCK
jgi:hypothetical protein